MSVSKRLRVNVIVGETKTWNVEKQNYFVLDLEVLFFSSLTFSGNE